MFDGGDLFSSDETPSRLVSDFEPMGDPSHTSIDNSLMMEASSGNLLSLEIKDTEMGEYSFDDDKLLHLQPSDKAAEEMAATISVNINHIPDEGDDNEDEDYVDAEDDDDEYDEDEDDDEEQDDDDDDDEAEAEAEPDGGDVDGEGEPDGETEGEIELEASHRAEHEEDLNDESEQATGGDDGDEDASAMELDSASLMEVDHILPEPAKVPLKPKSQEDEDVDEKAHEETDGAEAHAQVPQAAEGADADAESEASKKTKPAFIEEQDGQVEFRIVGNDGSDESMILLTGLKNIFQKQLPKMPKEYIARLVYDRHHSSMAVVRKPMKVLGGITFRPFNSRRFAEIVFCAISSTEQVKGYGSRLMSHVKDAVRKSYDIEHFLTYADNYAIGYFKKQGFTTDITLDKHQWVGYIKDYEGGTIMQCTMLPKVVYLEASSIIRQQRSDVMKKIKEASSSHIVHPGLDVFKNDAAAIDIASIPGIKEAGWTPDIGTRVQKQAPPRSPLYTVLKKLVMELEGHAQAWPFLEPVQGVPDYYEVIKEPMDLRTLSEQVEGDHYSSLEVFINDVNKIFDNCKMYNNEGTTYYKCAVRLEKWFRDKIKQIEREMTG
ncbi:uncharacterized protein BJ171DRAFT_43394 [Polychytrium aggregatum]|uniref:uncharacterized protein n=1 Tax=Polychytrium aggregatum TaxID=110093 RepID=UPI0022FF246F|nr:uncharacterized protein BJ171DRAFT_43394 [Polychytrium aggregatum]KAI9206220.1 hypothetical protein BJ171DRAFT_43394 [Polychytrium aggregatum]